MDATFQKRTRAFGRVRFWARICDRICENLYLEGGAGDLPTAAFGLPESGVLRLQSSAIIANASSGASGSHREPEATKKFRETGIRAYAIQCRINVKVRQLWGTVLKRLFQPVKTLSLISEGKVSHCNVIR